MAIKGIATVEYLPEQEIFVITYESGKANIADMFCRYLDGRQETGPGVYAGEGRLKVNEGRCRRFTMRICKQLPAYM